MPTHLNAIILQGNMEINNCLFMLSPTGIQLKLQIPVGLARSYEGFGYKGITTLARSPNVPS